MGGEAFFHGAGRGGEGQGQESTGRGEAKEILFRIA